MPLKTGIGEGEIIDDPDQAVRAMNGEINPGRSPGFVIPRDEKGEDRKGAGLLKIDYPGEFPRTRTAAEVFHQIVDPATNSLGPGGRLCREWC